MADCREHKKSITRRYAENSDVANVTSADCNGVNAIVTASILLNVHTVQSNALHMTLNPLITYICSVNIWSVVATAIPLTVCWVPCCSKLNTFNIRWYFWKTHTKVPKRRMVILHLFTFLYSLTDPQHVICMFHWSVRVWRDVRLVSMLRRTSVYHVTDHVSLVLPSPRARSSVYSVKQVIYSPRARERVNSSVRKATIKVRLACRNKSNQKVD